MKLRFSIIFTILATLTIVDAAETELWCYECNTNLLLQARSRECNDPYSPPPAGDLRKCPNNDSYVCLKSTIFYRNVHTTVRGCVPRIQRSTYCSFEEAYPEAKLECLFCDDYACNASHNIATSSVNRYLILASIIAFLAGYLFCCSDDLHSLVT